MTLTAHLESPSDAYLSVHCKAWEPILSESPLKVNVVRGDHTGLVVVGKMSGGGRHEEWAMEETVRVVERLESLSQPQ